MSPETTHLMLVDLRHIEKTVEAIHADVLWMKQSCGRIEKSLSGIVELLMAAQMDISKR